MVLSKASFRRRLQPGVFEAETQTENQELTDQLHQLVYYLHALQTCFSPWPTKDELVQSLDTLSPNPTIQKGVAKVKALLEQVREPLLGMTDRQIVKVAQLTTQERGGSLAFILKRFGRELELEEIDRATARSRLQ